MDTSPDTTASPRSCFKGQQKGREDEEGLERCGWMTSKTRHDCRLDNPWTQPRAGPNGGNGC